MKSAGRALRTVLAAILFAGPAAAQVRIAPVAEGAVAPVVGAVAPSGAGAAAVPSALTIAPAASLPAGLGSAPSALSAPAVSPAASLPAAAPATIAPLSAAPAAAVAQYRELQKQHEAIETTISPFLSYQPGSMSDAEYQSRLDRMGAIAGRMKALEAANPTITHDSRGPIARAWARLTGSAPALQAHDAAADGRTFDGAKSGKAAAAPVADEDVEVPEQLPTDVAETAPQLLELFVTKDARAGIKKGALTAHVGLLKGKGSEWYWSKFQKGGLISIKSGNSTLFVTRVEQAKTLKIASMQRKDFEGLFTAQRMAGKTIGQLRRALVQDLKDRQARKPGAPTPVSTQSEIRLVRFLSSVKARELPENKDESAYPVAPRAQFDLPPALQGINVLLPKTVIIDMRLFPNGVPYPLLEDMTKLMKAGVYFVLLSEKPNAGQAGSVEDLLTRQLSLKQRDSVSRYKLVIVSDDGNSLSGYSGNFSKPLPSERFTSQQLEMMAFVAQSLGAKTDFKTTRFEAAFPKGADGAASLASLMSAMAKMSLEPEKWQWSVETRDGKTVATARPQNLASAMPHLLQVMRDHEGVYTNNSDVMLVTRDEALLKALPGSVQPAAHLTADGVELADQALASLLGPYRENQPNDLAASASKISSFLQNPNGGYGGFGNIYMMTGHIMHSAFNWAIWQYRNTGVLPTAEETVAKGREIWEHEAGAAGAKNMLGRPGESLAGFYETVEMRLRAMHGVAADVLKTYPIAVGTELVNMAVLPRYQKGVPDGRDIFRLIFDFVVARETTDGKLEMVIVDFKTGQVPTLQSLEKDTQVQLYDLLVRKMWKLLPVAPYGANGERREVVAYKLNFLYTAGAYQPELNDWTRLKFEKFLKNVMNRIRRHNNPQPTKKEQKEAAAAAKAKAAGKKKA